MRGLGVIEILRKLILALIPEGGGLSGKNALFVISGPKEQLP